MEPAPKLARIIDEFVAAFNCRRGHATKFL